MQKLVVMKGYAYFLISRFSWDYSWRTTSAKSLGKKSLNCTNCPLCISFVFQCTRHVYVLAKKSRYWSTPSTPGTMEIIIMLIHTSRPGVGDSIWLSVGFLSLDLHFMSLKNYTLHTCLLILARHAYSMFLVLFVFHMLYKYIYILLP